MKISIITTSYNSGSTLCDTIESVLRQTYQDIEYLVIDGGSQDNTLELIRNYEPRFGGKLRYCLDAVYGDVHYVEPGNLSRCVRYYSSRPFQRRWMRFGLMPAHPSFYCRREIYARYGGFDITYKVAADFENLLRLIYVNRIHTHYIPLDFVTMRTGGASTSGLHSHRLIMADHLRALRTNGVYSNIFLLGLRYLYKIGELVRSQF